MRAKYLFRMIALILVIQVVGIAAFAQRRGPERGGPPPGTGGFLPGMRREPSPSERPDFKGEQPRPQGQRPMPDASFRFLSSEMRFNNKLVKGAPYSAVAETESVQPLMDGGKTTRKTTAQVYRDKEGRTRREQKLNNIGGFATAADAPQMIFIDDPVAGVSYMLDAKNLKARKMNFRGAPPPMGGMPPFPRQREGGLESKTESLGKQMIEGVEAEGTRTIITIPAGQVGNEKPLEIVSERWYSSALQEVILSKHLDPRLGEHIYRLTNINRNEPASSLFQPPADYTVTEDQRGMGPRGPKRQDEDEE
ncbi:MAG: hypothetical protein JST84_01085 [Acidobacteria bacterium]|nr:hypothetical protein [Acidobacteriota bacterium]